MSTVDVAQAATGRTESADLPETGRRTLLKGGLLALAGLVGWKAADVASGPAAATGSEFGLNAVGLRESSGNEGALAGDLVDSSGGVIGSVSSAPLSAASGPGAEPGTEFQTFTTPEGILFGIGVPAPRDDRPVAYAIVGGTGKYAGATGTYTAETRPEHMGGDGTAGYRFNLDS